MLRAIALLALLICSPAIARDNGQYADVDPATRDWVKGLKDKNGIGCCDTADGYDAQWDIKDGKFIVFIEGKWLPVPDSAVLDVPNLLGVAKVWYFHFYDGIKIRCFLPGPGT